MSKIEINFELLNLFNEEEINTVCKNADFTLFLIPIKDKRYIKYAKTLGRLDKKSALVQKLLPGIAFGLYKKGEEPFRAAIATQLDRYRQKFIEAISNIEPPIYADYADGFSYEGAIFTVSEQGGKKIRHGDSITTEEKYYWVRRQPQLPSFIPGIKMEKCGRLILKDNILNVFCGSFSSELSDAEFNYLTSYLRTNLKIHLLEKQPEFVPIWPPVVKTENGYIVNNREQSVYGYVVSGNDSPRIYVYQGIRKIPDELVSANHLICVKVWDQEALVNIDRKYVSSGTLLLKRPRAIITNDVEIYELIDDAYVSLEKENVYRNCNKILFKSGHQTDFILVRKNGQIEKNGGIGEYAFENLQDGDLIYVLQNRCLVSIFVVSIEKKQGDMKISDEELYRLFGKFKGTKKVRLPHRLRIQIYEIQDKVVLSKNYIDNVLKSNSISTAMIKVLEGILDE